MLFRRLGLRVVGARPACRPRRATPAGKAAKFATTAKTLYGVAGSETMEVLDTLQPGDTVTFEGDRMRLKDKAGPTTSIVTINRVAPEATVGVREAVLWPGRPDMCRLAEDAQGLHLAATVNNEVVGVVSLFVDGAAARFRKFAVLEAHRGAGVGSRVLRRRRLKLQARAPRTSTATRAPKRPRTTKSAATPPRARPSRNTRTPSSSTRRCASRSPNLYVSCRNLSG